MIVADAVATRREPSPFPGCAAVAPRSSVRDDAGTLVAVVRPMMGGTVEIQVSTASSDQAAEAVARRDAERVLDRLDAWVARLTRFSALSDLSRLNASPVERVPIRPTLAAVLDWARAAEGSSDGIVDVAMLDARLEAEGLPRPWAASPRATALRWGAASRRWSIERGARWSYVRRSGAVHFDLDGVAKSWLADRALARLAAPTAIVDADGDVAIRLSAGRSLRFGVADPRHHGDHLATLELVAHDDGGRTFGLATSGTSVHRWRVGGRSTHHLIDPATGEPARTDLVQATVLCASAREAEVLAKTAVIEGSTAAFARLDRPSVLAAILLTERGEVLATPSTERWLV